MTEHTTSPSPGDVAFRLCELEWMRQRLVAVLGCESLTAFVRDVRDGFGEIDAAQVDDVVDVVDMAESLVSAANAIVPMPGPQLGAAAGEVGEAAARALRDGIVDSDRALHAASWIEVRAGLSTVAELLAEDDVFRFWEVGVERFIASFRGADAALVEKLVRAASVHDTTFSALSDEQIVRLAGVLRGAGAR